jgi:peptidoglycan/LPS O-acetylase OafA/YrhL
MQSRNPGRRASTLQREASSLPYVPGLDGLRGAAVLLVLGAHALPAPLPGGFIGVDLFFVLSGFLITSLLLREWRLRCGINLGRFYFRRALRLLPALFAMLLVCMIYAYYTAPPAWLPFYLLDLRAVVFYFYNWHVYFNGARPLMPTIVHLWSLSVEEQFYLVWPVLLLLLLKLGLRRRPLLGLIAGGIVAVAIHRALAWPEGGNLWRSFRTDLRADALLWGVLIAAAFEGRTRPLASALRFALRAALPLAVAVLAWFARYGELNGANVSLFGFCLIDGSAAILIAVTVSCAPRYWRLAVEYAPMRWVGRISYGLYLWHYAILAIFVYYPVARIAGGPEWLRSEVAIAASVGVATLSHYYLERPILGWRDRIGRQGRARTESVPRETVAVAASLWRGRRSPERR